MLSTLLTIATEQLTHYTNDHVHTSLAPWSGMFHDNWILRLVYAVQHAVLLVIYTSSLLNRVLRYWSSVHSLVPPFCYVHVTVHRDKFLIIKQTRCTNFSNVFWNETLHISDSSSVRHQELFTAHTAMVYVVQVCRQLSSSKIRMEHSDPVAGKLSTNLYDIYHGWVCSE
jgi:hypothetical protein